MSSPNSTKDTNLSDYLYVDDELLDTANDLYAFGDEATLAGVSHEILIDAFVELDASEVRIRVNGEFVTAAYAAAS